MGDFTATRPHVYTTGAVIYAANHNNNENEIYNKHNGAINASTGHKHTGATGDSPKIDSTGLDLTAAYTWTGTHTFNNNVTIGTDKYLYFRDTDNYIRSSATDKLSIVVNAYDAMSVDHSTSGVLYTYSQTSTTTGEIRQFFRNSDSTTYFEHDYNFTSGDVYWALQSNTKTPILFSDTHNYVKINTPDVAIQATRKLCFDAGSGSGALSGDTYIYEVSSNILNFTVGGTEALLLNCTSATSTKIEHETSLTGEIRHYYYNGNRSEFFEQDYNFGAGDLYWALQSRTKTALVWSDTNSALRLQTAVGLQAGQRFYWDANTGSGAFTGNTYTVETSADRLDTYVGGSLALRLDRTANVFSIDVGGLYSWNTSGTITASQGVFSVSSSSASDLAVVNISGANPGAGAMRGLYFSTVGGTLDQVMQFNAAYQDGTARAYTNVNIPVYLDGVGVRYIPVYN